MKKHNIIICWVMLTLFSSFFSVFAANNPNKITSFSLHDHLKETDIIIDLQHPLNYQHFSLTAPPRFVIDFDDDALSWQIPSIAANPIIHHIRYAHDKKQHHSRLVIDLKKQSSVSLQQITMPNASMRLLLKIPHPMVATQPGGKVVIVIDPGHGGKDPGALGHYGHQEKNIVLSIAKKLRDAINQTPGFKAYLTRDHDVYLSLRQRLELARNDHADMFVAIHADAYINKKAHGASIYALSLKGATSEAARWLANRENASELMGGVELNDKSPLLKSVLLNLSQTATLRASLKIGQQVINALAHVSRLHHSRVEQAAFVVLKSPDIPSLLIEMGFISNPKEEIRLLSISYQHRLVSAMADGICQYFTEHPPRDSQLSGKF